MSRGNTQFCLYWKQSMLSTLILMSPMAMLGSLSFSVLHKCYKNSQEKHIFYIKLSNRPSQSVHSSLSLLLLSLRESREDLEKTNECFVSPFKFIWKTKTTAFNKTPQWENQVLSCPIWVYMDGITDFLSRYLALTTFSYP